METRWLFHRMELPLDGVPHFDTLHAARRLWKERPDVDLESEGGCRLSTLERTLFAVRRVGDVPGFEIPSRYFRFLRSGDPRPLEPVLEHNRLDLVSLAAVTARAARLVSDGADGCPDDSQALALGRIYSRAGATERAEACYRRATASPSPSVRAHAWYYLGLTLRRSRRFHDAAEAWRAIIALTERTSGWDGRALRQFAIEALAIHHEHRDRDYDAARDLALFALEEGVGERRADGFRHRVARLERKISKKTNAQLFWS
jgi:tetratricopeptide (TPR) repeat protein